MLEAARALHDLASTVRRQHAQAAGPRPARSDGAEQRLSRASVRWTRTAAEGAPPFGNGSKWGWAFSPLYAVAYFVAKAQARSSRRETRCRNLDSAPHTFHHIVVTVAAAHSTCGGKVMDVEHTSMP